jgi:hypothetical protein
MSFEQHHHVVPGVGASPIGQYVAVKQNPAVNNSFVVAASSLDAAFGLTVATVPSAGADCAVVFAGIAKAIAAASLGAGCLVAVASPNGRLGPVAASGVASALGNIQAPKWVVGRAMENCAAGGIFAVALTPGEIF